MFLFLAWIVFIFGPSCGGKSTLSKALVQEFGPSWVYLDRDILIEDGFCTDETADSAIEELIRFHLLHKQHIVVDTQIPWRPPKNENEIYVLVYAPLPELIARDARRTVRLKRSPERANYARLYVEETFAAVFEAPGCLIFNYNFIFDSSQDSVDSEVKAVKSYFEL